MASTKTKSRKSKSAKSATKTAAKSKRTKSKSTKPKQSNGNGSGRLAVPQWKAVADVATALVTVNAAGKTIARAPISTAKVEMVHAGLIGRKNVRTYITKTLGFKSVKQCGEYGGAKIGRTDLPDGVSRALSEAAESLGDPKVHKINGRALAAVIFALV